MFDFYVFDTPLFFGLRSGKCEGDEMFKLRGTSKDHWTEIFRRESRAPYR